MGEKRILIDGEEYISSGRAAELVGYSKDYVGQLARGGKIDAKRVGRNWYIREASINKHKLSVHYTLTQPKKKESSINESEKVVFSIDKSPRLNNVEVSQQVQTSGKQNASRVSEDRLFLQDEIQKTKQVGAEVSKADVLKEEKNRNEFNNNDLFPNVQKKQNTHDPLIHSDIRYEKSVQTQMGTVRTSNPDEFRSVAVRKPVLRTRADMHSRRVPLMRQQGRVVSQRPTISVDGVVITRKKSIESRQQNVRFNNVRTQQSGATDYDGGTVRYSKQVSIPSLDKVSKNNSYTEEEQVKSEFSKAVPVIGAIILFTVAAVLYLIFSS